jgi:hypothetical protein
LILFFSRCRCAVVGQRNDDPCAFAPRTGNFEIAAHLFDPLSHSGQTKAIMSISYTKSVTVVAELKAQLFGVEGQSRIEITGARVLERVSQRFLADV